MRSENGSGGLPGGLGAVITAPASMNPGSSAAPKSVLTAVEAGAPSCTSVGEIAMKSVVVWSHRCSVDVSKGPVPSVVV
jgi:hypothetical protein